jgi:hypothetical protein
MRILGSIAAIAFSFFLSAAQAATVKVDLTTLGVVGYEYGSCYCDGGPVYMASTTETRAIS